MHVCMYMYVHMNQLLKFYHLLFIFIFFWVPTQTKSPRQIEQIFQANKLRRRNFKYS